jgi:purine-binding chemotaxis protein CheW
MPDAAPHATESALYCSFRWGQRWFGVDARAVREIHARTACTPIPHAPGLVRGFSNLRGNLLLVLDLRHHLELEASNGPAGSHLVVLRPLAGESLALLVDQVGEIVQAAVEKLDTLGGGESPDPTRPAIPPAAAALVLGVARLPEGLLTIIDPSQILPLLTGGAASANRLARPA